MNDLSLALIRKGKGTGVVAGTTSHDLELALAEKYGSGDEPVPVLTAYLTFSSADPFTLGTSNGKKNWDGVIAYSFDGLTWNKWTGEPVASQTVNGQDQILLGGYLNTKISDYQKSFTIAGENISCTGDIRSLLDYEKAALGEDVPMGNGCFLTLFQDCTALITAPSLPATTLSTSCYYGMFSGCSNLQTAPALPATTLTDFCYQRMFFSCQNLTAAPTLPATTMTNGCYEYMFGGCIRLQTAPALPATTLAPRCYMGMFSGCVLLTSVPASLPATVLKDNCYAYMFQRCGFLSTPPTLPATSLAPACYQQMFEECVNLQTAPALPATTLAVSCYEKMFDSCKSLIAAPALPATTLAQTCYKTMFGRCIRLASIPELPATTLAVECYMTMFVSCTALKFGTTASGDETTPFRIPTTGSGTTATEAMRNMFFQTSGTFTGDPSINTTYYTNATIVPAA